MTTPLPADGEAAFRALAESAPLMIWAADADLRRGYFNPAWLAFTGRGAAQERDHGWAEGVHLDDLARCRAAWAEAAERRVPFRVEMRLRRADGAYRLVLDHGVPHVGPDGDLAGYLGTCTDIDDRKRAEKVLRDARRRKDEFLSVLAHELRSPLAPIRNALHVLKTEAPDAPASAQAQEVLTRQVDQLARLLERLLDVSRLKRGKVRLRKQRVDLADVVGRAVEAVRPLLDGRGHELEVSLPSEPLPLEADPVRLAQVFSNLLHNAGKYSERPGRIRVAAERDGGDAVVRVRDPGAGIAGAALPHVFDLFARAGGGTNRTPGGLGVGLAMVRGLVELHGGSVAARSAGPGQGSEFVVRLPLAAPAPAAGEAPRRRVLVVDDNVDSAESLALVLRAAGHDVRVAYNGRAALEAADKLRPEVVFLDIGLPLLDGYQVARVLRRRPGMRHALLLALTGYGQEDDRRRAREAGFDHYIVKPVDPEVLQQFLDQPPRPS